MKKSDLKLVRIFTDQVLFKFLFVGTLLSSQNVSGFSTQKPENVYVGDTIEVGSTVIRPHDCLKLKCTEDGLYSEKTDGCSKKCEWLEWSKWSECRAPCNKEGVQFKTRKRVNEDNNLNCNDSSMEMQNCTLTCSCNFTDWTPWSSCSHSCGTGSVSRTRTPITNNLACNDSLVETSPCYLACCPVDGKWSDWSQWSECSLSCDSGQRKRSRKCDNPNPSCNGKPCEGNELDVELCNVKPCEKDKCKEGKVFNNCSNSCKLTCASFDCDQQCHEPDTCEPGCSCPPGQVENEEKKCVTVDKCSCFINGKPYGPGQTYEKECETCQCISGCMKCTSKNCTKCELSEWTDWSNCTDKCNGISKRFRNYYGLRCNNNHTEEENRTCTDCRCFMNGTNFEDGSQFKNPNNKCEECKCIKGTSKCYTLCSETKESCLEKNDKANDQYNYNWNEPKPNECCGHCNKTPKPTEKCEVKKATPDYIYINTTIYGKCRSKEIQPQEYCGGGCESSEASFLKLDNFSVTKKSCRCCSAEETKAEKVSMTCEKTSNPVEADYYRVTKCKCDQCGGDKMKP